MNVVPTPDGTRYLALARGRSAPSPFHRRWLVPFVCRLKIKRWLSVTWGSWVLASVGVGFLAPTWGLGVAAGVMFAALPGIRYNLSAPILVDLPALCLAVWAAVAWNAGWWHVAIALVLLTGACKESAPVFAAAFAWTPLLLVGLLAVAAREVVTRPCRVADDPIRGYQSTTPLTEHAWILEHPFRAGWKYHRSKWLDGLTMLTPWGGALAGFAAIDWRLGVLLAVAYGQLFVATDSVRLYQWAAPVMCVAAVGAVPAAWVSLLVLLTVWNPWQGPGA